MFGIRGATVAGLVLISLGIAAPASAAPPVTLNCGDVVTQSVTLAADVVCTDDTSPGLVVGADGITIDLGGHTVRTTVGHSSQIGIDNTAGHDHVTIRNGTVATFDTTIALTAASHNRVSRSVLLPFGTGVVIQGGRDDRVTDSSFGARGAGIDVESSPGVRIVGNTVNAAFSTPILVNSSDGLIARNATQGPDVGIRIAGNSNRVVRNSTADLTVASGARNLIERNSVTEGVLISDPIEGVLADGLLVSADATRTVLLQNTATQNQNDGIHVLSPSTFIFGNVANENGNYGIEAVPGVISARNHASGNGNPAQCLNVVCS